MNRPRRANFAGEKTIERKDAVYAKTPSPPTPIVTFLEIALSLKTVFEGVVDAERR